MSKFFHCVSLLIIVVIFSDIRNVTSNSVEHCDYSTTDMTYKYTCRYNSSYGDMIKVNISDVVLSIRCHGISKKESLFFANLIDDRRIEFIGIDKCPIPEKGFGNLSTNFNTTLVKHLSFKLQSSNEQLQGEHFKGLGNLKILLLNKNNITVWVVDTLKYIPNVEFLRLDYNHLSLYDNMFQNATNLMFLSISYNELTYLPDDVFTGLQNLKGLQLTDNRIEKIQFGVFSVLTSLTNLNLSSNQLHHLDDNLFSNSPQLSWISLADNKYLNFSKKIFSYCRPEFVEVYGNIDMNLTDGEFSNFFSLELLDLGGNGLIQLPENLFSQSANLKSINLHNNSLRILPDNIFKDQENLEELFLSFNQIETLSPDIFSSSKKMKILYLDHNYLIKMSDYILRNSAGLRILDLSHNRLISFKALNISEERMMSSTNTSLNTASNGLLSYRKLSSVDLSHNKFTHFPEESGLMAFARNISVEHNSIEDFNTSFLSYKEVGKRHVNLENNNISVIYLEDIETIAEIYKNSRIILKISHNPIQCDCRAVDLVRYLSWTYLNNSKGLQFEYMNSRCGGPSSLKDKPLEDIVQKDLMCQLEDQCTEENQCDCYYQTYEKMLIVNCSNKHLLYPPRLKIAEKYPTYGRVDSVEVHLEGNKITEFLDNLGYARVSKIYLQDNFIKNISWIPPLIQVLDLSNNNLTLLDSKFLMTLKAMNIGQLNLANNPWSCDCENIEFSHFLEQHISYIVDTDNIRCKDSKRSLIDLNDEELCAVKSHRGLIALSFSLLFSLIIIMNILLCYVYRRTILTWLYAHGLCLWLIKEERIDKSKLYDAFISFANEDENFVVENLVPILEKESPSYKLCMHTRDWIPGELITTQLNNSVLVSRRTLVILSSNFLRSVWGKMEFRTAHTEALKEERVRVIVIIYGDIDMNSLDDEWKAYMRTNTYIKWGDPWFWEKLRYALPRRHKKMNR